LCISLTLDKLPESLYGFPIEQLLYNKLWTAYIPHFALIGLQTINATEEAKKG
jgi:hypothetical protein